MRGALFFLDLAYKDKKKPAWSSLEGGQTLSELHVRFFGPDFSTVSTPSDHSPSFCFNTLIPTFSTSIDLNPFPVLGPLLLARHKEP